VLADIRRKHAKPPRQKEAVLGDGLVGMLATLGHDLRDRAILLLGVADGLRRSEIVGPDVVRDDHGDGAGWVEIFANKGVFVTLRGETIGVRSKSAAARPTPPARSRRSRPGPELVASTAPLSRRIFKDSKTVDVERLSDKHVARLVKQTALAAGVRGDLPEADGSNCLPDTRCDPVSPHRSRSRSAMSRSSLVTPQPR
jgi:integrase